MTSGADALRDIALCQAVVAAHRERCAIDRPTQRRADAMAAFRLGLVGAGTHGADASARAVGQRAGACRRRRRSVVPTARAALRAAGVPLHADAEAMLQAAGLDGVLVAAPSALHLGLVAQVAAAGLPILCEKPCG